VFEQEIQDFRGFCEEKQKFYSKSAQQLRLVHIMTPFTFLMASMASNTQNAPGRAISSNFHRRVRIVGGCREVRISPDDNRNYRERQSLSSSIQMTSEDFFLKCKSLSWAAFETGSQLSQLAKQAFCKSGLTSIHLPASVIVIGESCFFSCGSLVSITFETDSQLSQLAKMAFCGSALTSIHLPASVSVIGRYCFCDCPSLTSITFESGSQLSELAYAAFC
jgi:hypothetical protein